MKETISVLITITPSYGEMLLGVSSVAKQYSAELLYNTEARDSIIDYLINEAPNRRNSIGITLSPNFQKIMCKYINHNVAIKVIKNSDDKEKIVNIKILDFFNRVVWPIVVKHYINNLDSEGDFARISLNVKRNVYLTIYDEDDPERFINEFKDFLSYNYIVPSEAVINVNGDILLKLLIPFIPE